MPFIRAVISYADKKKVKAIELQLPEHITIRKITGLPEAEINIGKIAIINRKTADHA